MLENGKMGRLRRVFKEILEQGGFCGLCGRGVLSAPHPMLAHHPLPQRGEVTGLLRCARNDIRCLGRSMIEMLGVLAIIGVLSVGGIAGYSKAMREWRSNQQRNMITELIASAIKIKSNLNPKSTSWDNLTPVLYAMGDIPEGMTYQNNYIYDKDGNYSDITYGLMTNSYTNAQYFMYIIRFYFRGNGNYLTPSVKDFCYNVVSATKSLTNEVLRIELVQSNSQSESNGSSTTIFSKKDLQTATPIDIQKKCDIALIDSNSTARFVIQLNPK